MGKSCIDPPSPINPPRREKPWHEQPGILFKEDIWLTIPKGGKEGREGGGFNFMGAHLERQAWQAGADCNIRPAFSPA